MYANTNVDLYTLQTDKWAWLHVRLQIVSGHGSHISYTVLLHIHTLLN